MAEQYYFYFQISSAYRLREEIAPYFLRATVTGFLPGSLIVKSTVDIVNGAPVKTTDLVTELQRSLLATNNRVGSSNMFVENPVDAVSSIEGTHARTHILAHARTHA